MNFKKVMSGALALISVSAVLTSSIASVSAASAVTVAVGSATAKPGEEFEVNVSLANVPSSGLLGADFAIGFDSSKVSITSVTEGTVSKTGAAAAELALNASLSDTNLPSGTYSPLNYSIGSDAINVAWMTGLTGSSNYWIKQNGVFITIKGTVKSGASGTAEFTVEPVVRSANNTSNSSMGFASYDGAKWGFVEAQASNGGVTIGSQSTTVYGDVNLDGNVTAVDVIPFMKHFLGATLTGQAFVNADVLINNKLELTDLATLKQFSVGDKVSLGIPY